MHINQTRSSLRKKATSLYIGDGKPHPLAASFNFLFQTNINNNPLIRCLMLPEPMT